MILIQYLWGLWAGWKTDSWSKGGSSTTEQEWKSDPGAAGEAHSCKSWRTEQFPGLVLMSFNSSCKRSNNPTVGNCDMDKQAYWQRQRGQHLSIPDSSPAHRGILKYSRFFFLVQWHFVALYPTLRTNVSVILLLTVSSKFSVLLESLLFLMASCHLSQEGVRGQCSLWSMARVLCTAAKLSLYSLFTPPVPQNGEVQLRKTLERHKWRPPYIIQRCFVRSKGWQDHTSGVEVTLWFFLSFRTGQWELLTSGHMSAISFTQQCPTFHFA